jgi:hypothetical protein
MDARGATLLQRWRVALEGVNRHWNQLQAGAAPLLSPPRWQLQLLQRLRPIGSLAGRLGLTPSKPSPIGCAHAQPDAQQPPTSPRLPRPDADCWSLGLQVLLSLVPGVVDLLTVAVVARLTGALSGAASTTSCPGCTCSVVIALTRACG